METEIQSQTSNQQPQQDGIEVPDTPQKMYEMYTFLNKLGEGSQGNVYRGIRKSDGKIVAIKKLRIDSVNTWKEYDLFHREASVLESIHEHGVAEFYEAHEFLEEKKPAAYIVQELIEGRSLQKMLKTGFRFTVSRIFKMAYDLIGLLEKLHNYNPPIIHRDIKPNNIIMKPLSDVNDFEPYLIDFGAVANPTVQKGGSTVAGTYGYMPPEQLVGRPCPASDIYSLAATIVYMLTGIEPAEMRIIDFRLIIDPYLENVPRPIVNILNKMLDPKPETRLSDYGKLKQIFERFANDDYMVEDDQQMLEPALIDAELLKVKAFNQAGNLNLWMMLPEETPRNVPMSFAKTILALDSTAINSFKLKNRKQQIIRLLLALAGTVICVLIACQNIKDLYGFLVIAGVGAIYSLLQGIRIINTNSELKRSQTAVYDRIQDYAHLDTADSVKMRFSMEADDDIPILTLLKFGRKAIATIVDFEDSAIPERYRSYDPSTLTINSASHVPFVLRYRFNPPDDASANDLIHTVTIYNHQTEGLEPGTPIPILYYIDPKDNSNVMSIPYPFPFEEIINTQATLINKQNLYGETKGVY